MQKKLSKILILLFLIVFIFQIIGLVFLLAAPGISYAKDKKIPIRFTPQVPIPGMDAKEGYKTDQETGKLYYDIASDHTTAPIAKYIKLIYKYSLGIVGILATVIMMFGGALWMTAGGNAERITNAKSWITASLTGLALALTSYMILFIVNPDLVNFKVSPVKIVGENKSTTTQSDQYECGKYIDAKNICGTKCEGNKKCEAVTKGTSGAKECPSTLNGNGDYWLCTTLSGGGSNCCTGNDDSQCNSSFVCNMKMVTADCMGKGVCAIKQNLNGICGENADCISNNCDTGWFATYRCQ